LQADPPRTGRVRPWLGGISRNVAKRLHRSRARRLRREVAAARPDRAAAESTEKLRWQQRVVEEVLALDPKYRDVLLLRYYEELPPRAIAARLDLPVNTVRTRTRRGIELLRGRFDERFGRKAWTAGLAGFFATEAAAGGGKLVAAALVALVAGTAWVGHVALRGEGAGSRPRSSLRADEAGDAAGTAAETAGSRASVREEAAPLPTHFRGRLLVAGSNPPRPLAQATVHLADRVRAVWAPVASVTSDGDGRFTIPWDREWPAGRDREGHLYRFYLYVEREGRWADPLYADARGFGDGAEIGVELLAKPRFRFVRGEDRVPVPGVRLSLQPARVGQELEREPAFATGTAGEDGIVEVEWPTHRTEALLTAVVPGADRLEWPLDEQGVRSYDPYDVWLDPEEIATVYVRVLDRAGKPAGPGTRVAVQGRWAPDADGEEGDWNALGRGSQPRPLFGVTDADGRATFRFPADRARYGAYVPDRMIAWDDTPRVAVRDGFPRLRQQIAGNGESLPTLRFGDASGTPHFLVAGRQDEVRVHWRGTDGRTRVWETFVLGRIPGYTALGFDEAGPGPGPLRGRGTLSVVASLDDGFAWRTMDEAEFARSLDGTAVVRLDRRESARSITLHPHADGEAVLEAIAFPFAAEAWLAADHPESVSIPAVAGSWRVRFDGTTTTFDPAEKSELRLE
jgi:hypothetical protein